MTLNAFDFTSAICAGLFTALSAPTSVMVGIRADRRIDEAAAAVPFAEVLQYW